MITLFSMLLAFLSSIFYYVSGDSSCAYPLILGVVGAFVGLIIETKSNPFKI